MSFINILVCSLASLTLAQPLEEEHEIVKIGVNEQAFEADYYFEKTGEPQGGLIFTHSGNHPRLASNLAYILSQHGWSVLIVTQTISTETENTKAEPTQTASAQAENPEEIAEIPRLIASNPASLQLDAAIKYMETNKGLFNLVLLSSGPSWQSVSRYMLATQGKANSIRGLILHNAEKAIDIKDLESDIAILDIATLRAPSRAYQSRKIHAKRYKMSNYQQLNLHLPPRQVLYGEDKLSRRIRGWLRTHVKGMEIGKNS